MRRAWYVPAAVIGLAAAVFVSVNLGAGEARKEPQAAPPPPSEEFAKKLKDIPYRIVYETFRDLSWELFSARADGSDPVNLTNTPNVNELYPHVSPDGARICFVVDEVDAPGGEPRIRNAYYMNMDGTGRTKIADNAREACWNADGTEIAYLPGEFDRFCYEDYATRGIVIYDLKTGSRTPHPNKELHHLYNLCWSPDGNWFVATVHGGMGYKHSILAIEARGTRVFDLGIPGCRPDISPDGTKIAWGASDWELCIADISYGPSRPVVTNRRVVVRSAQPIKIYHIDWSPDGRYVTFSRGPEKKSLGHAPEMIGIRATGWNICVADAQGASVWTEITADGKCNKEPDWAPLRANAAK
jgi:Tol biopolymer transport system component